MTDTVDQCASCYGTGEVVTDQGAMACPDCFGEGKALGSGAHVEWRLRELERQYETAPSEAAADVQWLLHQLRRSREALVRVLTLCHDADESDRLAREVKYQANEALGFYDPEEPGAA
jgi:hypothetical protein